MRKESWGNLTPTGLTEGKGHRGTQRIIYPMSLCKWLSEKFKSLFKISFVVSRTKNMVMEKEHFLIKRK